MAGAIAALILVVVTASVATGTGLGTRSAASDRPTDSRSAAAVPRAVDSAKTALTPAPQLLHFPNGIFEVGVYIRPGNYRSRAGSSGCYFARLKGFGGSTDDILANGATDAPAVVTILPTDRGFQSDHCATWTVDLSPIVSNNSFGPGDYIVGTDLQPGTYRNRGGSLACYFARLRGFTHAASDVIANVNTQRSAIVSIAASDRGFASTGCGTWTKVR